MITDNIETEVTCPQQIFVSKNDMYWHVEACTPYGVVFRHFQKFRTKEGAENLANRMCKYIDAGGRLQSQYWDFKTLVPNSAAHMDDQREQELFDTQNMPLFYSRW